MPRRDRVFASRYPIPIALRDGRPRVGLTFNVSVLLDKPAELAGLLGDRIKLAAKFLGRSAAIQHSAALEVVAQAMRFPNWHHLSAHLWRATAAGDDGRLPAAWPHALSGALFLLVEVQPEIAMPEAQLQAFETVAQTLAMLTDTGVQEIRDGVCAALCAGKTWAEVRVRNPLKATTALYLFVMDDPGLDDGDEEDDEGNRGRAGGCFDESQACSAAFEGLSVLLEADQPLCRQQVQITVDARLLAPQHGAKFAGTAGLSPAAEGFGHPIAKEFGDDARLLLQPGIQRVAVPLFDGNADFGRQFAIAGFPGSGVGQAGRCAKHKLVGFAQPGLLQPGVSKSVDGELQVSRIE